MWMAERNDAACFAYRVAMPRLWQYARVPSVSQAFDQDASLTAIRRGAFYNNCSARQTMHIHGHLQLRVAPSCATHRLVSSSRTGRMGMDLDVARVARQPCVVRLVHDPLQ